MSETKYELHITGECKQNLKLCKKEETIWQRLRKNNTSLLWKDRGTASIG